MPLQDRPGNLGRAIRLMLAPADMAQTRQAVGELLFALSDRDGVWTFLSAFSLFDR